MIRYILLIMMLLLAKPLIAAEPLRVFVGEFNAVGVQSKDETKTVLQSLMTSRLANDKILPVSTAAEAEVLVGGTYVSIGKQYNIDAFARTVSGQTLTRSSVHGEGGQEALFAAVGNLAEKVAADLGKMSDAGSIPRATAIPVAVNTVKPKMTASSDIVRTGDSTQQNGNVQHVPQTNIIRPQEIRKGAPKTGEIKRLDGMYNLLALGERTADGKRVLFVAQNQSLQAMREGEVRPFTGFSVNANQKIIGIDYVDADGNGKPELYVTMVTNGEVDSQVWELKDNHLVKIADGIPYFFRAIALAGGPLKLYAQEQGRKEVQFYGDVYEVVRQGKKIVRKAKIPMPRYGNVYSFNQFRHPSGELLTVVFHDDNYLVVYDKDQKELWRSNDAFGGSELYYQVEDDAMINTTTDKVRWFFLNQRIQVTSNQEVLVGKNDGFFVIGNARMYKRGAVYSLYWNGAALEEVWRTKDTQNYMPDYYFDESRNELLLLQLTQREDVLMRNKGASALQIKKVE